MKALCNLFVLMLASFALASCGGGGGGSNSAFSGSPAFDISISASPTSVPTNSFTTLTVTVKDPGGSFAPNGTAVSASLTPTTIGSLSSGNVSGAALQTTVVGGTATFLFNSSSQTGTAHITVTVSSSTQSIDINVTGGNSQDPRLQLSATATSLPLDLLPYDPANAVCPAIFLGSPYVSEVTVTWRHSDGELVSGTNKVNASVAPTSVIGFSILNSGSSSNTNPCLDNFHTLLGSGPVDVTGGVGTIYIVSGSVAGTGTLSVTAIDPDSGQTISSQLQFTVAGGASGLPASIFAASVGGAYVQTSGGISTLVSATVTDGSGNLVADPNGYDDVQFSISGPAGSDAKLSAVNAAGQTVTGATVATVTHNGIASITFLPGNQQGPVQVKATTDRADGNVDNGIQDPVSATATVVVSDGKLYSLQLTSPGPKTQSLFVNAPTSLTINTGGNSTLPPSDGTYSYIVSAIGTDRQGNPVLPTTIKFGSVDSPVDGLGDFLISGLKGDAQPGGTLFSAQDGAFTTAGGGAGPGDTLLVFGKLVNGASDLESAATVKSVQNAQNLTVGVPFNLNDTTGTSVNPGPVLPYIIGRAQIGNISSPATTNAIGVATTTLNYPVSELGHVTGIWAQGTGTDNISGGTRIVTDIALAAFPGEAPATITVSPSPIPGNITTSVTACITDATGSPVQGIQFQFSFGGLGIGSGTLDGISSGGTVPQQTDASGCVATTVATTGITGTGATLTFTAPDVTPVSTPISATGGGLILIANPSALGGNGGTVTLSLLNGNGTPVSGVQLTGTCSGATVSLTSGPGVTNSSGQTKAVIAANLNQPNAAGSGSCTFSTATGSPTAIVTLQGVDPCKLGLSPAPTGCTSTTGGSSSNSTVMLNITATTAATASITSNPTGASCGMTASTSQTCPVSLAPGTYTLTATVAGPATFVGFSGNCTPGTGQNATLIVPTTTTTGLTCTLKVN